MAINGINTMQAIISAGSAMTLVERQGSVATSMKGREGILESEIKLDSSRGRNVEKKQEELDEVQKRLTQVQTTQMNTLADASKQLEEARKEDQKAEAAEKKETEKKAAKKKTEEAKKTDIVNEDDTIHSEEIELHTVDGVTETVNVSNQTTFEYSHVDIRL